jgi:hypothetical protein
MTNRAAHAARELDLLARRNPDHDEADEAIHNSIVQAIEAITAGYQHSGGSMSLTIEALNRLLNYENLTPLTDDPDEWIDRSEATGVKCWQNRRNPKVFNNNGPAVEGSWNVDDVEELRGDHPSTGQVPGEPTYPDSPLSWHKDSASSTGYTLMVADSVIDDADGAPLPGDDYTWGDASNVIETAWALIANAGGGNWDLEADDWREAAGYWRDRLFEPWIKEQTRLKEEAEQALQPGTSR